MPSAKELYEQGLIQRQAEEAARIKKEEEQKRAAAEEEQRQREKRVQEEERQREKRAQEEERMLKQMNIKGELDGLNQSVDGSVGRTEKGMSLIFDPKLLEKGLHYAAYQCSVVNVDVVYDPKQQKAVGVSINGRGMLTTPKDLVEELANATLNPKKEVLTDGDRNKEPYSASTSDGSCAGGC